MDLSVPLVLAPAWMAFRIGTVVIVSSTMLCLNIYAALASRHSLSAFSNSAATSWSERLDGSELQSLSVDFRHGLHDSPEFALF